MRTETFQSVKDIFVSYISQFPIEILEYSEERVYARWTVEEKDFNALGIAHGGAILSVADTLAGALGFSRNHLVTKDLHFYYHRPVEKKDTYFRCRYAKAGRRSSLIEVEVLQDKKLCAKGFFTMVEL